MINLFIDSDKRLWVVDEQGRLRPDTGDYLLYFSENEFEEIGIACAANIHGNIIRHYDTVLAVRSDKEHLYPVSFTLGDDGVLRSEEIPVDSRMTARVGEAAVYVRFVYQEKVIGRTNPVHFKVRSSVCDSGDIPQTLRVTPAAVAQEFSAPSGYDRVEVAAVESEELVVAPDDSRQVFLPSEGRYFGKVTVDRAAIALEDVTVTPTYETQYVTASEGNLALRTVVVEPMLSDHNLVRKTVSPTVSEQHITPDSGYLALSEVTVNPVTADIDEHIRPSNIREGVSILGVEGILKPAPIRYKQIRFVDYDGEVLYDYSKEEFAALEELPEAPVHEGLISGGWSHTLQDLTAMIQRAQDEIITVGAVYTSSDGHSHLYFELEEPQQITLNISLAERGGVTVDWGDGSSDTYYSTEWSAAATRCRHTYASAGSYDITVSRTHGKYILGCSEYAPPLGINALLKKAVIGPDAYTTGTFANSRGLTAVVISEGVTEAYPRALYRCRALRCIVAPPQMVFYGEYCFADCPSLETLVLPASVRSISSYFCADCISLKSLVYPVVTNSTSTPNKMFSGCTALESVLFSGDFLILNSYAFENCRSLKKARLPDSVTNIYERAFYGCISLESFTLPQSTVGVGQYAFSGCKNLKTFVTNNALRTLGNQVFDFCELLEEINLPASITSLGEWVFSGCHTLSRIDMSALASVPGKYTFNSCYSLKDLPVLNPSINKLINGMFSGCAGLESIVIPAGITQIMDAAFNQCENLSRVDLRQLGSVPALQSTVVFSFCSSDLQFIVRDEDQKAAFLADSVWREFSSKFVIE